MQNIGHRTFMLTNFMGDYFLLRKLLTLGLKEADRIKSRSILIYC